MDVLSDLLHTFRLQSQITFAAAFPAAWGFHVPAHAARAPFYVVQRGRCSVEIDGDHERVLLDAGELVWFPHGSAHTIRSTPEAPVMLLDDVLAQMQHDVLSATHGDAGGAPSFLIAGAFHFTGQAAQSLRAGMGALIQLDPADAAQGAWLGMVMQLLCMEAGHTQPGAERARAHLLDVLLIHLVRASMAQHGAQGAHCNGSFLRALFDPHMSNAMELIHRHPEHKWTVAALAAAVNMSRTGFAMRFAELAGMAPLAYVRQWRMLKAAEMLVYDAASLAAIATRVGYDSVAAFSTTFKREMGVAPATYRYQHRTGEQGHIRTGYGNGV